MTSVPKTSVTKRCTICRGAQELYIEGGLCACHGPPAFGRVSRLMWEACGLGLLIGWGFGMLTAYWILSPTP